MIYNNPPPSRLTQLFQHHWLFSGLPVYLQLKLFSHLPVESEFRKKKLTKREVSRHVWLLKLSERFQSSLLCRNHKTHKIRQDNEVWVLLLYPLMIKLPKLRGSLLSLLRHRNRLPVFFLSTENDKGLTFNIESREKTNEISHKLANVVCH